MKMLIYFSVPLLCAKYDSDAVSVYKAIFQSMIGKNNNFAIDESAFLRPKIEERL